MAPETDGNSPSEQLVYTVINPPEHVITPGQEHCCIDQELNKHDGVGVGVKVLVGVGVGVGVVVDVTDGVIVGVTLGEGGGGVALGVTDGVTLGVGLGLTQTVCTSKHIVS
jgi:hypothetical protein